MPEYKDVAGLPIERLLTDEDNAETSSADATLQDVADSIMESPARAVVVTNAGRIAGIVTETDLVRAMGVGKLPDSRVGDVLDETNADNIVLVDENVSLKDIPRLLGTASRIVVTKEDGSEVRAVVRREDLADRIRKKFS